MTTQELSHKTPKPVDTQANVCMPIDFTIGSSPYTSLKFRNKLKGKLKKKKSLIIAKETKTIIFIIINILSKIMIY
jgi:hypothetical protein